MGKTMIATKDVMKEFGAEMAETRRWIENQRLCLHVGELQEQTGERETERTDFGIDFRDTVASIETIIAAIEADLQSEGVWPRRKGNKIE